jgi:hypothetical protein
MRRLDEMEAKFSRHGGHNMWVDPRIPSEDPIFHKAVNRDELMLYKLQVREGPENERRNFVPNF